MKIILLYILLLFIPLSNYAQELSKVAVGDNIIFEEFTFKGEKYYLYTNNLYSNLFDPPNNVNTTMRIVKGNTFDDAVHFLSGNDGGYLFFLGKNEDYMFFAKSNGENYQGNNAIISSDGSLAGTVTILENVFIADLYHVNSSSLSPRTGVYNTDQFQSKVFEKNLLFLKEGQIWKTDGTTAGTLSIGINASFFYNDTKDRNIYYALDGGEDNHKYIYINSSNLQNRIVKNILESVANRALNPFIFNSKLFLSGSNGNVSIIDSSASEIVIPTAHVFIRPNEYNRWHNHLPSDNVIISKDDLNSIIITDGVTFNEVNTMRNELVFRGNFIDKYQGLYYYPVLDKVGNWHLCKSNGSVGNFEELPIQIPSKYGFSESIPDDFRPFNVGNLFFFPKIVNGIMYALGYSNYYYNGNVELLQFDLEKNKISLIETFSADLGEQTGHTPDSFIYWNARDANGNLYIANIQGSSYYQGLIPIELHRLKFGNDNPVSIRKLNGNFYKSTYTVPKESTVHQYFIVKDNIADTVIKGAIVKYKLSNEPDSLRSSLPSDSLGIVDLNITLGGADINTSDDDWLSGGSATVSFRGVFDTLGVEMAVGLNTFKPFIITVTNLAEPIEKEFGLTLNLGAALLFSGPKLNIAGVNFEAGFASAGLGATYSPSVTIVPDNTNPNLWQTKLATPLGIKLNGSLGPSIKFGIPYLSTNAGATANLELKGSTVDEQAYNLNMGNLSDGLFLGSQLFAMSRFINPSSLLLSNFLYRLASYSPYAISSKKGLNVSAKPSVSAGFAMGLATQASQKDNDVTSIDFGIGVGAFAEAALNFEISTENTTTAGNNDAITISASTDYNSQVLFGGNGLGIFNDGKISPFTLQNNAKNYAIALKRNVLSDRRSLNKGSVSFSSDAFVVKGGQNYKQTLTNTYEFSRGIIKKVGDLRGNFIANYMNNGATMSTPVSVLANHDSATNAYNQILNYQKRIIDFQDAFDLTSDDVKISTTRDITKVSEHTLQFELSAFAGIGFELGYMAWNRFGHPYQEYKFSKEAGAMLKIIDYSNTNANLELPDQDPFFSFMQTLINGVETASESGVEQAKSFVKSIEALVGLDDIFFSNSEQGNAPQRVLLNGTPQITQSKDKNSTQNSAPSAFTFIIPSGNQTFNQNTKLNFSYYYPENQLNAATQTDTFKIITETYFLSAKEGNTELSTAPNGNFTINTQFSSYELELAGLPLNLIPRVLFLPNGSNTWEIIGLANQPINFNRLGIFVIGVNLEQDSEPPIIAISPPSEYTNGEHFSIFINDNLSGIDWSKTYIIANGQVKPFQRVEGTNEIVFEISNFLDFVTFTLPETFELDIYTIDLSNNKKEVHSIYPCSKNLAVFGITGGNPNAVTIKQARENISLGGAALLPPPVSVRAGNSIIMNAGFSVQATTGGHFKAEIGGCQ